MGILEIKNRTENWKTAKTFAPFFNNPDLRLKLVKRLGEPEGAKPDDIKLELFWKGMQDYIHMVEEKPTAKELANIYGDPKLFGDLRSAIAEFRSKDGHGFRALKPHNYSVEYARDLRQNLLKSEIDIVIESPNNLFIGEAKDESGFDGKGKLVLVHQLIREYVLAKVLLRLKGSQQKVVPFIVRNKPEAGTNELVQIEFMKTQDWLQPENILTWKDVSDLAAPHE